MYRLNEAAQTVIDLYESFDWKQIVQLPISDVSLSSNKILVHGKEVTSFGSCSYLGLNKDSRLIEGGINALQEHGIVHSSSRSYTHNKLYEEFEDYLEQIFGLPTLAITQTTMAHFSVMHLLMLPTDVAIIDMQAHASMQTMIQIPIAKGLKADYIMHNNLDQLEKKIKQYQAEGKEKIWYIADGIYSMFGDAAPVQDLLYLLEKYDNFYIYFDDAHGMSWTGPKGAGYVWKHLPIGHPRVIMATSLNKGFGASGGAIICPNEQIKSWLTKVGPGFVFCKPLDSQTFGAGIASAKIHLSDEIYVLQNKLKENITFFNEYCKKIDLDFIDTNETPIFFKSLGGFELAIEINEMLIKRGYYLNLGSYPAVPLNKCGIRLTITKNHSKEEITGLLDTIKDCINELLTKHNLSQENLKHSAKKIKASLV